MCEIKTIFACSYWLLKHLTYKKNQKHVFRFNFFNPITFEEAYHLASIPLTAIKLLSALVRGSRVGAASEHSPPTNVALVRYPGLGVISGLSLLVLYSAPRGFSPGTPVFPSPLKPTFDLS